MCGGAGPPSLGQDCQRKIVSVPAAVAHLCGVASPECDNAALCVFGKFAGDRVRAAIADRDQLEPSLHLGRAGDHRAESCALSIVTPFAICTSCLLYTSD